MKDHVYYTICGLVCAAIAVIVGISGEGGWSAFFTVLSSVFWLGAVSTKV